MVIFHSYVKFRAGLRVCPERNELRLKEAHFTVQAQCSMTLVHLWVSMFHINFSEKSVRKVNLLQTSCMSAFSPFSLFWSYIKINPKWNLNRKMVHCSMGPGMVATCINPKWNPNRNMVNCFMGPQNYMPCIYIKPKWDPKKYGESFHGVGILQLVLV